ncbi:MAG: fructose bisphosphate aldolase [Ilumatobacter sp.]|jgi:fructose-bisphosphate aldolase, class I|uniref:fructose bisphosphate aldolase n=1 Tax=Ilumatobacter sp. TaxID=1967498 RepID=UPI00391C82FC
MRAEYEPQRERMSESPGFIAALDQSGGSAPLALARYGIDIDPAGGPGADESTMLDMIHEMRVRIMTSPSFTADHVLGAILFAGTLDRTVDGLPTAEYLWKRNGIVPFVKIDVGLAEARDGVRLMLPIPGLDATLGRAVEAGVFGTKMRSVIDGGDASAMRTLVDQQFSVARRVLAAGLIPIIEPEVSIEHAAKVDAEHVLRDLLIAALDRVATPHQVMLKLTLPTVDGAYQSLIDHPRVLRVAALSGGYSRNDATERLSRNPGMIASFSRALTEGLRAEQSDAEFDAALATSIATIYAASIT